VNAESNVEDLQAVSQHVRNAAEEITNLESEKREVDPGSPLFRKLSDRIEALAEEIRSVSHAETSLAREVAGQPGLPTIAEADRHP